MIGDNPNIAGRAIKEVTLSTNGKYSVRSLGKILIRSNILNSIRQLGSVVGHELNHMTDYVNGAYAGFLDKYGPIKGPYHSEVNAYRWQETMGAPFEPQEYSNYLNLIK